MRNKLMVPEGKFREILEQLLVKSRANKVHWVEHSLPIGVDGERYAVSFSGDVAIEIYHVSPASAPDYARAELIIAGRYVERVSAEEGDEDWELLVSLYNDARRCVFRIDMGLDVIEKSFDSDRMIGLPETPPDDFGPPSEEIPF
jgi:hypothetical protein